ncbi:hypothetical protein D3C80_1716810 [compost metagenome]
MCEGQRIVEAPGLHETADQDHAVNNDGEQHPGDDNCMHTNRQTTRQSDMRSTVALPGHRREVFA